MIARDTSHGFITADISLADARNLIRALDRQIRANRKAQHFMDAEEHCRLRDSLQFALNESVEGVARRYAEKEAAR